MLCTSAMEDSIRGVTERETKQMHIYPNPATEMVYVALDGGTEIANMVLYDLQGRIVETYLGASLQSGTATLNVEALPAGIYLLHVTGTDGSTYHHKIVKK